MLSSVTGKELLERKEWRKMNYRKEASKLVQ